MKYEKGETLVQAIIMNCKLEKFWNFNSGEGRKKLEAMNCKLEKFWNDILQIYLHIYLEWTVNLKSFEIIKVTQIGKIGIVWTVNLKSFEIIKHPPKNLFFFMNCKLEKFWN